MKNHFAYPKISLITPSLNQGQFIERTIQSVLSQKYPNLEYIVMDGGSTDNTLSILRQYSAHLTWVSQKDEGQTDAINQGFQRATGDVLAYLNADDLLLPGTLNLVAEIFLDKPDIVWVTGRCQIIDESGIEIRKLITLYKNSWLFFHSTSSLIVTDYISQPATFWRTNLFHELGPLDKSLHYAMDYDYWLKISTRYPLTVIPKYLAAFRIHNQSKNTTAGNQHVYIKEERQVIEKYTQSFFLRALHDGHRYLMTFTYSMINRL